MRRPCGLDSMLESPPLRWDDHTGLTLAGTFTLHCCSYTMITRGLWRCFLCRHYHIFTQVKYSRTVEETFIHYKTTFLYRTTSHSRGVELTARVCEEGWDQLLLSMRKRHRRQVQHSSVVTILSYIHILQITQIIVYLALQKGIKKKKINKKRKIIFHNYFT